ncbi:MAG: tRNA pseudouridine(38-40) synthase TruA, partial [Ginsengibacter sp.]
MARFFIEVAYKGTKFSGFQVQHNAVTVQSEVELALNICFKETFNLTGASRTDSGVHARQNFFHVDTEVEIDDGHKLYNLNAIISKDIVITRIFRVSDEAHCRFDAICREYKYYIYTKKDPFLQETAYYFPYHIDFKLLQQAAIVVTTNIDFTSFSKRNTQVNNFICSIQKSEWLIEDSRLVYNVSANRFLRGMVKGLVGTMLLVGTGKISLEALHHIFETKDCSNANFAVPPHGLFLEKVTYPI